MALSLRQWSSVYFCRWFPRAAGTYYGVPFLGAVSGLSLAVGPFSLLFAVLWGIYRNHSYAWIGQDVLVRTPFRPSKDPSLQIFIYFSRARTHIFCFPSLDHVRITLSCAVTFVLNQCVIPKYIFIVRLVTCREFH